MKQGGQQQSPVDDGAVISAGDAMPEDDPNGNVNPEGVFKPRWGPNHIGAKKLATLYSRGEHSFLITLKQKMEKFNEFSLLFAGLH